MLLHVYINYNLRYLFKLVVMLFLDCSTVNGAAIHAVKKQKKSFGCLPCIFNVLKDKHFVIMKQFNYLCRNRDCFFGKRQWCGNVF